MIAYAVVAAARFRANASAVVDVVDFKQRSARTPMV
jgi:hypothetical protein